MELTQRKIKAFPLYMGQSGCDYHRVKLPFIYGGDYYDDDPYKGFEVSKMIEYINMSELLVYNRMFPLNMDRLRNIREHGVKIVCDLDDWFKLPDYHPNYRQYKDFAAKEIVENLKFADVVTVTTDRLYQKVKEYNKNIHVIPNALPFGHGQFIDQPKDGKRHNKFNFIYTGQSSHLEDVRIMQAQIKRASKLNVSFTLAGYKPGSRTWNGIEKVFNQGGDYERINAQPLDRYMQVYDSADCSLVPLCINDFNSCKSNLKLLESAAKKIPCIVSHVAPYKDDVDAPVLWVKTPDDWYKHIKYLSEHPDEASQMGEDLHRWALEKYNLHRWNKARFELYRSLI